VTTTARPADATQAPLVAAAAAGDAGAFRQLTDPHRRELAVHDLLGPRFDDRPDQIVLRLEVSTALPD
jgi:hypothetical protein